MAALTSQKVRASYEQLLHVDRDGGGNGATTVSVKDGDNGTTFAIMISTTKVAVGPPATLPATPDGTFHVHTATAGSITAVADGDDCVVENSGNAGITILCPAANAGGIYFGDPDDADVGYIKYDHASEYMNLHVGAGTGYLRIYDGGKCFINDTANGSMTTGLTINQGANDDEVVAYKSSDVEHGVTDWAETDTYFAKQKASGATGGIQQTAFSEATTAMIIVGIATTDDTTHASGAVGPIVLDAYKKSGTGAGAVGANANAVVIRQGSSAKFIVDAEGDYHYDGADAGAFDEMDDALLVRSLDVDKGTAIKSQFDDFVRQYKPNLIEAKILGRDTLTEAPFTGKKVHGRGLVNGAQLQRLHNGAIWQGRLIDHAIIQTIGELLPDRFGEALRRNMEALGIGHLNLLAA